MSKRERASKWLGKRVKVREREKGQVSDWVSEWVKEWVGKSVSKGESMLMIW